MSNEESVFNKNDFVYLKNGDSIESSGYKINSLLMNEKIPPLKTMNSGAQVAGGSVSSLLNDLAVPAGLLLIQQKAQKHYKDDNDNDTNKVVDDDLFDKLLKMAGPNKNKKLTKRKHKSKGNNRKTKRR